MNKLGRTALLVLICVVLSISSASVALAAETQSANAAAPATLAAGSTLDATASKVTLKSTMVQKLPAYTYSGKAIKPAVKVYYHGKLLRSGTDYAVTYRNNVKVGTASVKVTGKGSFKGSVTKKFKINKHILRQSMITLGTTSTYYTGEKLRPSVVVRTNSATLKKGVDYTVKYVGGFTKPGTYKVVISPKGGLKGKAISKSFAIKIPSVSFDAAFSGAYSMKLVWNEIYYGVNGYQVQYSTSRLFKKGSTHLKSYAKNVNYANISKASKYTRYYVRVRAYRDISGKRYYSDWSSYKYMGPNTATHLVGTFSESLALARYTVASQGKWYPSGYYIFHCNVYDQYQVSLKSGSYRYYYIIVKETGAIYDATSGSWRYVGYAG